MQPVRSQATLSTFALAILIVGAIDSIRNLPATALFGSALPFFFILSTIFFLLPVALVSAELSSASPEKGGIYHWVKSAFGDKVGFLAIWLQWINTMVWFPSVLSFIAGTVAYLIDPTLAANKWYLISVILVAFWSVTWISIKGFSLSVRFANACVIVGMVIPVILIITLGAVWLISGQPLHVSLASKDLLPSLHSMDNWVSLTAIVTSFLGLELAAVHVQYIKQAQRTFPKALAWAVAMILVTMLFGALTIAFVLPAKQINLVNGVMEAFESFFKHYHLQWFIPVMAVMIFIGSIGQLVSWMISPAKGLLQAAETGYLPTFLAKLNDKGIASRLLILQALLVSLFCFAFSFMPSVNGSYWLLSDLSTQLYVLMYILMFLAAVALRYRTSLSSSLFRVPGGNAGMLLVCLLGLIGCVVTLVVGFVPPDSINVGGVRHYEMVFGSGMIAMLVPVIFFYYYKMRVEKRVAG